mgnify:CR=1 FL=1
MTWPKGKMFPTVRPYTPVSPLGIQTSKSQSAESDINQILDQRGALELLVKKYPEGKASTYLHSLNPGNSLYFLGALFVGVTLWLPAGVVKLRIPAAWRRGRGPDRGGPA